MLAPIEIRTYLEQAVIIPKTYYSECFFCYLPVHAIVGTPGRVLDLMNKELFKTDAVRMLVLDEVK